MNTGSGKMTEELTVRTILKFLKDRDFPSGNAVMLGVGLGLPSGKLNKFRRENSDLDDLLMVVIDYWLRNDSAKSWDKLADALRFCDCNNIADEIQGRRPPTRTEKGGTDLAVSDYTPLPADSSPSHVGSSFKSTGELLPDEDQISTDTGDVPTGTDTGDVPTGTDTGDVPTGTDVPTGSDTGDVPTGTDTGDVPTGTDTGDVPTDTAELKKKKIEAKYEICTRHEEKMKLYCFDCNSLICRDCTIKDHSGHKYDFINLTAPNVKKKLIEQLDPLKEIKQSLSRAVKEVKNTKCEIEAQGHSVAGEIESSFEGLVKILEKHKQELLKKAALEVTHKLECLCVQEKSLSISCAVIESVIEYTEQCVEHSADDEVMCMHVELENRIAREMKEQCKEGRSLEPVEEADIGVEVSCNKELEQLCQTKAKVIQLVDPTKCIVTGEGAKSGEISKTAIFSVKTNLNNGRLTKQKCTIDCRLKSLMTGSIVQCDVNEIKGSEYHIQYTPTVHGDHELIVTVNGEVVADSPFPVCVSIHPTQLGKPVKTLSGLEMPFDVAVNSEGEIIVTLVKGDVVMFNIEGRRLRSIKRSDHKFTSLKGVAVDKEDNIYFVDVDYNYTLYKTNKKMEIITSKRSKYPSNYYFGYVAVIGDEVMLSASNNATTIEVYNADLEYVRDITPRNIGPETVGLYGISSDEHGTLYVSDANNKCIQVLSNNGEFLRSIAHKLIGPQGLCVAGQYVYVAERDAHKISVYTSEGEHVTSFGQRGCKEGDFYSPYGVCVDRHGLVYVRDFRNNRVQIF